MKEFVYYFDRIGSIILNNFTIFSALFFTDLFFYSFTLSFLHRSFCSFTHSTVKRLDNASGHVLFCFGRRLEMEQEKSDCEGAGPEVRVSTSVALPQ